jgi:uncharacterized damage-inducible protein DinB
VADARGLVDAFGGRVEEMRMKPILVFTTLLFWFSCSSASAQTTDAGYADALTPSLASVARTMHVTMRRNIVEAAEAVPASEYSFRPTPDTRTFAQLVGHIINANWFFCSQAKQERPPNSANHEALSDKAVLVKALHDAMSYCDGAYEATTDANFNQPVQMQAGVGMGPASTVRGAILTFNTAHDNEHYGNIVVYMRLKGHTPPSTLREAQASQK